MIKVRNPQHYIMLSGIMLRVASAVMLSEVKPSVVLSNVTAPDRGLEAAVTSFDSDKF